MKLSPQKSATVSIALLLLALAAGLSVCRGQQDAKTKDSTNGPPLKKPVDLKFKHQSFTFVRIQYSGVYALTQ